MSLALPPVKLGFIPANRGFFSAQLAVEMRHATVDAMAGAGLEVVVPDLDQTSVGCVESRAEAELVAKMFRDADVDGIVIGAVNFGDEQAAAWCVRQAKLDVPVLIFGCQEPGPLKVGHDRRDAFCGLLSIGEALRQIGARYSVATRPICYPGDASFRADLDWFAGVCRVVKGVRGARYAQIGARPEAFWTCRFDEKQLQRLGPTTVVLDLSEAIAGAEAIASDDGDLQRTISDIHSYADTSAVATASVERSARFELFLRRFQAEHAIDAFAVQCWTAIQQQFGVCACTTLSRLGDVGVPAACEADILGTLSMHACMLASARPAALADWNNLHNDDDQLVNVWHCGVFPKSMARAQPRLSVHGILVGSGAAPADRAEGIVELQLQASPLTLSRITQDADGSWKALVVQGDIEDNPATTEGSYGWCRIPDLQQLYRNVLLAHFPHHVAITQSHAGNILYEALGNYLDMSIYHATQPTPGRYNPALPF